MIRQDYSSRVVTALEGKMTITYWVSCFGFAAPCYMQFLSIYLDEAEYAVIHFNTGCHSIGMSPEEWGSCLRAVFDLIRQKQPKARIVWTTTTLKTTLDTSMSCTYMLRIRPKDVSLSGYGALDDEIVKLLDTLKVGSKCHFAK